MASKALAEGMLAERRHNSFRSASRPTGTMTQIITLPLILLSKRRCSRFAVLVLGGWLIQLRPQIERIYHGLQQRKGRLVPSQSDMKN